MKQARFAQMKGLPGRLGVLALVALVAAFVLALPSTAYAESMTGGDGWTVTFNKDAKMVDNYSAKQWADDIRDLQPGDDITFTVNLKHEHGTTCDWYMSNEVLKTLEEGVAAGSAYGYRLAYVNPSGQERVLYDSTEVGGDSAGSSGEKGSGLFEATNALDDWFFLDALKKDQTARVTLKVTLDGETEGNAYFDTLAQLKMKFAVELDSNDTTKKNETNRSNDVNRNIVQTGDETNLFPFFVAMATSGVLLLMLGAYSLIARKRRREAEEAASSKYGNHAR